MRLLKESLAARQYWQVTHVGARAFPPAVLWEYYCRLNRRATAEVAAVPVAQYADRVPAPNNKELEEFFEKYKARYPNAASPEPGFRVPKRIAVQYFAADLDKFADSKDVTKAEVDQEYEAHKDQYEYSIKAELKKIEEEKKAEAEKKTQAAKKAATKKTEPEKKPPADKKDQAEKKTEAGPKPEAKKTDIESKPEAAKKPAVQVRRRPGPRDQNQGGRQGRFRAEVVRRPRNRPTRRRRSTARPIASWPLRTRRSRRDGASGGGSDTTHRSEARREQGRPARQGRRSETACGAKQSAEPMEPVPVAPVIPVKPSEEKPSSKEAKGPKESKAAKETKPEESPEAKAAKAAEAKEALERVKDAIRKQLAKQKAWKKIDTIFLGLEDLMNEYQRRKVKAENPSPHAAPAGAPTPLDFAALAKQYGLTSGRTKLLSDTEIVDENIGKSVIEGGTPFQQYAYKTLVTLKPTRSFDATNCYLFWVVNETNERIPKLDEPGVRQEVVKAWKMVHARKIALEAADKLAAQARQSGKSLKRAFPDRPDVHVTETDPFSWMTYGSVPADASASPPKLSEVEGVDMPGEAFMRTVFGLKQDGIGVAINTPQTVAYVVRVIKFEPATDALMGWFERDPPDTYLSIDRDDIRQMLLAQRKEFHASVGLKWEPRPAADSAEGTSAPLPPEPDSDD